MHHVDERKKARQRGMTLIETLFAFLILMVVSVAILELITLSVAVNQSAAVRTDLSLRAQQTCEAFRTIIALSKNTTTPAILASCGVTLPIGTINETNLTNDIDNVCWGKTGFNILDPQKRFQLSYSICDGETTSCVPNGRTGQFWVVSINVKPQYDKATYNLPQRVVSYVAQITKY